MSVSTQAQLTQVSPLLKTARSFLVDTRVRACNTRRGMHDDCCAIMCNFWSWRPFSNGLEARSQDSSSQVLLHAHTSDAKLLKLWVCRSSTVQQLKQMIASKKPVGFYPDDGFKITHHGKVWNDEEQLLDFNLTDGAVLVCWPNWRNRHRSRSNAAQCSSIHHDQEASPGVFILDAEEKQSPECLHATSDHAAASSVVANPETREWPSAPARVQNHRDATQLPVGDAAGVQEKSYCAATASSQRGASSDVGHRFLCESPDQSPYADSVHLALNSTPPRLSAEGGTLKADCAFNQQSRVERSGEGACEARNSHAVATADCKAEENRTTTNLDTLDRLVWTERVQSEVGSDLKREDGYSTAFESFEQESPTGHLQSAFEDARHKHLPLPPGNLDRRASDENDEEEEEDDMMLASPPIQYSREMSLDAASSKNSRGRQISHDSIVHMDRPLRK